MILLIIVDVIKDYLIGLMKIRKEMENSSVSSSREFGGQVI